MIDLRVNDVEEIFTYSIEISYHICVADSNSSIAMGSQLKVAFVIALLLKGRLMDFAINFDDQTKLMAVKVSDRIAHHVLAQKFKAT